MVPCKTVALFSSATKPERVKFWKLGSRNQGNEGDRNAAMTSTGVWSRLRLDFRQSHSVMTRQTPWSKVFFATASWTLADRVEKIWKDGSVTMLAKVRMSTTGSIVGTECVCCIWSYKIKQTPPAVPGTFYKSRVGIPAIAALFPIVFYGFLKLFWGFLFTGCLLGQRSSSPSHCSNKMQRKRPWRIMSRSLHSWIVACCLGLSIRLEEYSRQWPDLSFC